MPDRRRSRPPTAFSRPASVPDTGEIAWLRSLPGSRPMSTARAGGRKPTSSLRCPEQTMDNSGIMAPILASAPSSRLSPTLAAFGVLVVAHRQLHLHVFGGVQSVAIFEMSISDGAGASQAGPPLRLALGPECMAVLYCFLETGVLLIASHMREPRRHRALSWG